MKKTLFLIALVLSMLQASAQTYVSGGIYANTTWTKAASPYVVTDHVVVFPGATLTIEPGVMVKFDSSKYLEIRHAKIVPEGLSSDPITFTSNATIPKPNSWFGIIITNNVIDTIRFLYCNFQFASSSLSKGDSISFKGKLIVKNCNFSDNVNGINARGYNFIDSSTFRNISNIGIDGVAAYSNINSCSFIKCKKGVYENSIGFGQGYIFNCLFDSNKTAIEGYYGYIENCTITNNEIGIFNEYDPIKIKNCQIKNNSVYGIYSMYGDTILNNEIDGNKTGIVVKKNYVSKNRITNNKIGISILNDKLNAKYMILVCNKICANTDYDLITENEIKSNLNFPNNFWCTPDSASTRPRILDGYIDPTLPLVNFMPLDTSSCYSITGTGILETKSINTLTKLYPNPFSQTATLAFENPQNRSHQLTVFNTMGQMVMSLENIKGNQVLIDRKELQSGLYFYQLRNEGAVIGSGKVMIE